MNGASHDHDVALEDAFDFMNTLEHEDGVPVEHLVTSADALAWLADHGLLHATVAERLVEAHGSSTALLDRVRGLRAALREITDAIAEHRSPDPPALTQVNAALRARGAVVLEASEDGVRVGHRHEGDPVDNALAWVAEPVVREIASGRPDRFRVCASDDCRWVFYDASPTGRRRWCSMASCGNRAKAARHRARVREGASSAS